MEPGNNNVGELKDFKVAATFGSGRGGAAQKLDYN